MLKELLINTAKSQNPLKFDSSEREGEKFSGPELALRVEVSHRLTSIWLTFFCFRVLGTKRKRENHKL